MASPLHTKYALSADLTSHVRCADLPRRMYESTGCTVNSGSSSELPPSRLLFLWKVGWVRTFLFVLEAANFLTS
jgi:hypothetical protein